MQRLTNRRSQLVSVIGADQFQTGLVGTSERVWRHTENPAQLLGPDYPVGGYVPLPAPQVSDALGLRELRLAAPDFFFRALTFYGITDGEGDR